MVSAFSFQTSAVDLALIVQQSTVAACGALFVLPVGSVEVSITGSRIGPTASGGGTSSTDSCTGALVITAANQFDEIAGLPNDLSHRSRWLYVADSIVAAVYVAWIGFR